MPKAPDYMAASSDAGGLKIVSPLNPGPMHTYDSVMKMMVHELTHLMTIDLNPKVPRWLKEGIASYEARQMDPGRRRAVVRAVRAGAIPSLPALETMSYTYGNSAGFQFTYALMEYLVQEFGWPQIRRLVREPDHLQEILGLSADKLWGNWVAFLKVHYSE